MTHRKRLGIVLGTLMGLFACSIAEDTGSDEQVQSSESENEDDFEVLDRMGYPEMSNVTIGMGKSAIERDQTKPESELLKEELKNVDSKLPPHVRAYNRQNTFHPKAGERAHARRILAAGIRASDTVGVFSKQDWSDAEIDIITDILSEDALVVDISKPCTIDTVSFFDIEREEYVERGGKTTDAKIFGKHQTCGGRTPNDDIIDDVLTMWVNKSFYFSKDSPRRLSDNIDIDTPPLVDGTTTSKFPYLGEPHKEFRK
jgi:hypothetical protein